MKDRTKFLLFAIVLVGMLALIELFYPRPISWHTTLSSDDKVPFGLSVLKSSIVDLFEEEEIIISRESFFLMSDSLTKDDNFLVICEYFLQGEEDFEAMLSKVTEGASILISAYGFNEVMQDSLGFSVSDNVFTDISNNLNPEEDSTFLEMIFPRLQQKYTYRRMDAPYYFELDEEEKWTILIINEESEPVAISRKVGSGQLILSCTPLAFSNYYILYGRGQEPASALLSQLPDNGLHWTEFYSRGRGEPLTPLRYVLSTTPLRWAYYVTIFAVFAFVFFEAKRKQRPVPIIQPPRNDSLDFVKTVGNLYYENGDHKNIVEKKIQHLLDHIRSKFHLQTTNIGNQEFYEQLAKKSGKPLINVEGLFTLIEILQKKDRVHEDELKTLNSKIEAFLKP